MIKEETDLLHIAEQQRLEIQRLRQDLSDLEIALETAIDHGDSIEEQLLQTNDALIREANERIKAEDRLHKLITALTQQKDDLEVLVETITAHTDDMQYEWLERLGSAEEEALTDALTSVSNRRHFDQYLDQEWKRAIRYSSAFSLIMVDIDHFKLFNDYYGHQAGDSCIRSIAEAGRQVCNRSVDLFARYGGEEFAIVLPDTDHQGAVIVAKKLLAEVESLKIPHEKSSVGKHVTISIGVASCQVESKECDFSDLLKIADDMLYAAKEQGRNRVVSQFQKKIKQ